MCYQTETGPGDIEFSDDMFIITRETAEKYLAAKAAADLVEVEVEAQDGANGKGSLIREELGQYVGVTDVADGNFT